MCSDTGAGTIDLQNCICPPLSISPNAGTTCNDVGTINLNNTIQGAKERVHGQ
ncbi:MAG: hypothetical protein IPM04_09315 [Saprospiraceae bacterium]|nr:hypothetical protein [Candidatus Brachybacter algidus]MBK8748054.1 hypothetical protein [Candidatus Brachybacter algidus]